MHENLANEVANKLGGMLPKMTAEQIFAVAKKLDDIPYDAGMRAVVKFANENTEFNLAKFQLILRDEKHKTDTKQVPKYRYVDVLRRDVLAKQPDKAALINADDDVTFAIKVGRAWWKHCSQTPGYRAKIARDVRDIFILDCGMTYEASSELAESCFDEDEIPTFA